MKTILNTTNAPTPIGPYNQAVIYGDLLFTSGQIAINPKTGELVVDNIQDETKQVMENIMAILNAADLNFNNLIKATIFIRNMNDFAKINAVYSSYFSRENAPARETVEVSSLPKNVNIEISIVAGK